MPLTRMHTEILSRIAANRSPDSYVAGATVLHRDAYTPRFSDDLDLFHDVEDTQEDLDRLSLREPLDLRDLKQRWIAAADAARAIVATLPPREVGCLYLGPDQRPLTPDATAPQFDRLKRHRGRVRGAWPTMSPYGRGGEERPGHGSAS